MVRIKHRYLLLNFLYPNQASLAAKQTLSRESLNAPISIEFRRPSSDQLTPKLLLRMIRDGVAALFGDYGSGMVSGSLQSTTLAEHSRVKLTNLVKYLSTATSTAIVRVSRAHYRMVWASLSFVTHIPRPVDQACAIQVIRVSGTIKKSEEAAIRKARAVIVRARAAGELPSSRGPYTDDAGVLSVAAGLADDMEEGIEDSDDSAADYDDE